MVKSIIQNKFLKRSGEILILIIWLESTTKILLSFKMDTGLLDRYRKSGDTSEMCEKWWLFNEKKGFKFVVREFKNHFKHFDEACRILEDCWIYRDLLSHPIVGPEGEMINYPNKQSRKDHQKQEIIQRLFTCNKLPDGHALKTVFDEKSYRLILGKINKMDEEYFPKICAELSINYTAIRWPIKGY